MNLENILTSDFLNTLVDNFTPLLLRGLGGLVILIIGLRVIKWLVLIFKKYLASKIDENLVPFLVNILSIGLKVLLVVTILSTIGVETTSFAALIGSLGLAAGMALSGSLQNFASAFIIFVFKPFEIGETIKYKDIVGKVKEIKIFNTVVQTFDKPHVYIPNNELTTNVITNYSRNPVRRAELNIGVSYNSDLKKTKEVITKTLENLEYVLEDPAIRTGINELGDNSVNFKAYYYVNSEDYIKTIFETHEAIKVALDKAKIELPFPNLTVNIKK